VKKLFRWCYVLLLAGCTLFTACAPVKLAAPERTALPPAIERQLWENLQASGSLFQSLEGLAKVQVDWQGKNATVTQVLLVEKPDRFRAETLNPFGFGSPLLLMATDGSELAVMVPGEGRMFRGEATSRNLQRFTKVPLPLEDLVHLMLYQVPVISYDERTASMGEGGDYLVVLRDGEDRRQELLFNPLLQLVETAYYQEEELALRVRYDNFSEGANPFPRAAFLEMPMQQAKATLAFSELKTNVTPALARFSLATPPGYEERPIPSPD